MFGSQGGGTAPLRQGGGTPPQKPSKDKGSIKSTQAVSNNKSSGRTSEQIGKDIKETIKKHGAFFFEYAEKQLDELKGVKDINDEKLKFIEEDLNLTKSRYKDDVTNFLMSRELKADLKGKQRWQLFQGLHEDRDKFRDLLAEIVAEDTQFKSVDLRDTYGYINAYAPGVLNSVHPGTKENIQNDIQALIKVTEKIDSLLANKKDLKSKFFGQDDGYKSDADTDATASVTDSDAGSINSSEPENDNLTHKEDPKSKKVLGIKREIRKVLYQLGARKDVDPQTGEKLIDTKTDYFSNSVNDDLLHKEASKPKEVLGIKRQIRKILYKMGIRKDVNPQTGEIDHPTWRWVEQDSSNKDNVDKSSKKS